MNIGGEDRPLKFGLNQTIEFCTLREISVTQYSNDINAITNGGNGSQIRDLIWSALKEGARQDKKSFDYTNFDVGDWMETLAPDELKLALTQMAGTLNLGVDDDTNKKKVVA